MCENPGTQRAHRSNAEGDFYVLDQCCIACTAPEHEAPELMAHDDTDHCYFKRQPETPDELDRAIMAVAVGCCGAVRYGGRDGRIIERIVTLCPGEDLCDHA
jgi:hypothetical protein